LTRALIHHWRSGGVASNQVVALRRWLPETRLGSAFRVPVNLGLLLRTASRPHAVLLLGWIWLIALVGSHRGAPALSSASGSPPPTPGP
jgi:hypothetical protein